MSSGAAGAGRAARAAFALGRATRWTGRLARGEVVKRVGGPARARVIVLFGAVLALNGADTATVGAVAPQLESCPPHRQHQDRVARVGFAARRGGVHDPGGVARGPVQADADAVRQHPPLERRLTVQRVRRQLRDAPPDSSGARRGGGHRRPRDRLAHGRLLPGARARADLRLHPRRRDRRDRGGLHRLEQRGQPDRLAGGVRAAGDSGLLPRPGAVADRPRAPAGWPESPRAGSARSPRSGRAGCLEPGLGVGAGGRGRSAPRTTWPARRPRREVSSPTPTGS